MAINAGNEASACLQALQKSSSFMLPVMLKAAEELDVLGIIARAAGAGVSARDIASEFQDDGQELPGTAKRLDRMLSLLASHSILTCSLRETDRADGGEGGVERVYGLTATTKYFLQIDGTTESDQDRSQPTLAGTLLVTLGPLYLPLWGRAKEAILGGESQFEKVHGMPLYKVMSIDPAFNSAFDRSMVAISTLVMEEVLNIYNGFEGLSSLVDVGGGSGKCLDMVISKYPSIRGINFDQSHVIREAPAYSGIEHVGGDMFVSIPEGDAIMIKDALHNWDDEHCIKVLKNCYKALPEKGKVIAINMLMPEASDSNVASQYITQIDSLMMLLFESHERTVRQFKALCAASGFSELRMAGKLAHSVWAVMEFHK